jgi:predicted flap endonuclease-1-like 5' DNA nuclease
MLNSAGAVSTAMYIGRMKPQQSASGFPAQPLPISKLRGVPVTTRKALKRQRINTCPQLLAAAAAAGKRAALAQAAGIAPDLLTTIVQRADMGRVQGIGVIFDLMLEEVGVCDVATLAQQDATVLHLRLKTYNQRERLSRRSPTLEEVEHWVEQAKALPVLVSY